jgi:hypothetical protein
VQLENVYQNLFRQSVVKHFPEWDGLSPFDPSKIFVESLSLATAEIERRHSRLVETLLDSLPSLFGFAAKDAAPPMGLFQMIPSPSLAHSKTIPAHTAFNFPGPVPISVEVERDTELLPITQFVFSQNPDRMAVSFYLSATVGELALTFLPTQGAKATARVIRDIRIKAQSKDSLETRYWDDLVLNDETQGFSTVGRITIKAAPGTPAYFNAKGPAEFTIDIELSGEEPLAGLLICNGFKGSLVHWGERVRLGILKGEPWEEIPLSPEVIAPPDSILLHYPDDHTDTLQRLESDLLKLRLFDQAQFGHAFFYNNTNHSLILPRAPELMGNYSGGITVMAPRMKQAPPCQWFSDSKSSGSAGEWAAFIGEIKPIASLELAKPREDRLRYLKRFYTCLRAVNREPIAGHLHPDEISQHLLGCHRRIEHIEIAVSAASKELSVFVLIHEDSEGRRVFDSETRHAVSETLGRSVPLDYTWKVHPFKDLPLRIEAKVTFEVEEEPRPLITDSLVNSAVTLRLTELLSLPFWQPDFSEPLNRLATRLRARLISSAEIHPVTDSPELLKGIELVITDLDQGTFLSTLSRRRGERFKPEIQVRSSFVKEPSEGQLG